MLVITLCSITALSDFCYFANCMCILYVLLFWGNARFFFVIFTLCNGPLAWAIVAWRNSLVFHSLDKVTTVFIHGFPPLFTYCHRWLEHRTHSIDCSEAPNDCGSGYSAVYGVPLLAYLLWQALYVFKTDVADKRKLKQDTSIQVRDMLPPPLLPYLPSSDCSSCSLAHEHSVRSTCCITRRWGAGWGVLLGRGLMAVGGCYWVEA